MTETALAAAARIIQGNGTPEDSLLAASMLVTTLAAVAKLGGILESVGLSHSQAVQIIKRMNDPDA